MKNESCYWCGLPAESFEHVPSRSLFPKRRRKDLITVPSCIRHNEHLSDGDQLFRFYLQAASHSPEAYALFSDKTMRSIERPQAATLVETIFAGSEPAFVEGGETLALKVDPKKHALYFEKIVRGLFFHRFGRLLPGTVVSFAPSFTNPRVSYPEVAAGLVKYRDSPGAVEPGVGQPEIFRYRYFHHGAGEGECFLVWMLFYATVEVIGMASASPGASQMP